MTAPSDENQPSTEQPPAPFHLIDGISFAQLYEQLAMLRFSDVLLDSAVCAIAIPSPVGLQLYDLAYIMPARIHPFDANPNNPFEPDGQNMIIFVTRARPQQDPVADAAPKSPPVCEQ